MKKALVIVDMQNDFLTGSLGNAECAATVPEVIKLIASGEYDTIITTQDTHGENYMETQEGRNLPVPHCIRGTKGHEIQKDIKEAIVNQTSKLTSASKYIKGIVLEKPTFGSEILAHKLKFEFADYDEIHFCGVCTGICVISNVLLAKAAVPETKIVVIEKACACVTPESHKTAIEAMKMCQVEII